MANNLQAVSNDETEDGSSTISTDDEQEHYPSQPQEPQDFWSLYPRLCASLESEVYPSLIAWPGGSKEYVKKIISGMGEDKAREMEEKWKAVSVMRQQLDARRTYVMNKLAAVVSDVEESGINGQQVNEALVDDAAAAEDGIVEPNLL